MYFISSYQKQEFGFEGEEEEDLEKSTDSQNSTHIQKTEESSQFFSEFSSWRKNQSDVKGGGKEKAGQQNNQKE